MAIRRLYFEDPLFRLVVTTYFFLAERNLFPITFECLIDHVMRAVMYTLIVLADNTRGVVVAKACRQTRMGGRGRVVTPTLATPCARHE